MDAFLLVNFHLSLKLNARKMALWIIILLFSTLLLPSCDACVPKLPSKLHIRNQINDRQVEGFAVNSRTACSATDYVIPYMASAKGGVATLNRGPCELLYVTAKLKIPVTPPINIPIVDHNLLPSLTVPGKEEQCRTYVETNYNADVSKSLFVKRNATTNECFITTDP